MTTATKPICEAGALPDPTGEYLMMVFPKSLSGGKKGWMEWQAYYVNVKITRISDPNCQIEYNLSTQIVPYTQNGNDPNSGKLQFSLSINSNTCSYDIDVYQLSGRGLILQGTVTIGSQTLEVRLLKTPIPFPAGSYDVTSVNNSSLTGTLSLDALGLSSTFQQTGKDLQFIQPTWNDKGKPNLSMLVFSANIVVGGVSEKTSFDALYDPKWSGGAFSQKFHGTAAQGPKADDSDWSAAGQPNK
jgi:hypothetical protein